MARRGDLGEDAAIFAQEAAKMMKNMLLVGNHDCLAGPLSWLKKMHRGAQSRTTYGTVNTHRPSRENWRGRYCRHDSKIPTAAWTFVYTGRALKIPKVHFINFIALSIGISSSLGKLLIYKIIHLVYICWLRWLHWLHLPHGPQAFDSTSPRQRSDAAVVNSCAHRGLHTVSRTVQTLHTYTHRGQPCDISSLPSGNQILDFEFFAIRSYL